MSLAKHTQADEHADDAKMDNDELSSDEMDELERERRRIMARNRAKLIALGIPVAVMELQDLARRRTQAQARPRARSKVDRQKPAEPTRRSTRLAEHGVAGSDGGGEAEPLLQLGEDGGVEVQGARPRLQAGPGRRQLDDESGLTEEEIAAKAELLRQRETTRLRELELEGLVDFSEDVAVFVVLGSTGNHYTVRLSDERRSCQCMDCRVRKRDCKHIRLILGKLQISDKPSQWHEAVERCFHPAAATTNSSEHAGKEGALTAEDAQPPVLPSNSPQKNTVMAADADGEEGRPLKAVGKRGRGKASASAAVASRDADNVSPSQDAPQGSPAGPPPHGVNASAAVPNGKRSGGGGGGGKRPRKAAAAVVAAEPSRITRNRNGRSGATDNDDR